MKTNANRPLTVLQFGMTYAPRWSDGGPPRIMYDYARHLLDMGVRVIVLTGDNNRPGPDENWSGFPPNLEVHYCRKLGDWRRNFYFDYSRVELERFFNQNWRRIDFIHLYQTRCLFNVVALWAARKYGIRIALSSFGSMPRRSALKYPYDWQFVLPLVKEATLLLAQTAHEAEIYRQFGGRAECVRLLPLAVDLSKRPQLNPGMQTAFRAQFGIAESARLFLFVGRLHATKGVEFLVHCFARVARQDPGAHLAIVGHDEGSRAGVLQWISSHGLEKRVTLCGPLFDNARWPAYLAADCFVILPEIFEETSLASLEALSCGTPVLTNRRADVPWLEEYRAGRVLPEGEAEPVVEAMLEICRCTPAALARKREAAMRLSQEKFEIGTVTKSFANMLGESSVVRSHCAPIVLVGPLPGVVETSGQAACFHLLLEGFRARRLPFQVVNIGSAESSTGKPSFRRLVEYFSIIARLARACFGESRLVYLTIAQSRQGFLRDAVITVIAKLTGNQIVLHLNGGNYANFYRGESRPMQMLIRFILRESKAIVVLAEGLRECFDFDPRLADRLRVVPNSFATMQVPAAIRDRAARPDRAPTLLYLSNLIESKGYLEVLEVLHHLRTVEHLEARAVFCGKILGNSDDIRVRDAGQARALFEGRIKEFGLQGCVDYRGTVGGIEKDKVLRSSDFLVFPTRYDNEGQPVVLIEALAYGLPSVTTAYRANGEMIVDNETGFLVRWNDTAGMARRIAALWRDPAAYAAMSQRCRVRFEQHFTPTVHLNTMQRVLFD